MGTAAIIGAVIGGGIGAAKGGLKGALLGGALGFAGGSMFAGAGAAAGGTTAATGGFGAGAISAGSKFGIAAVSKSATFGAGVFGAGTTAGAAGLAAITPSFAHLATASTGLMGSLAKLTSSPAYKVASVGSSLMQATGVGAPKTPGLPRTPTTTARGSPHLSPEVRADLRRRRSRTVFAGGLKRKGVLKNVYKAKLAAGPKGKLGAAGQLKVKTGD